MGLMEIFKIATSMVAGLALFLTGMNTLSDTLSMLTGGALNRVIGKITKNKFLSFLFGAALTAVVQSSSAITVLAVGLVNSGIVELGKAIGLIIGANLGTTATAWILSLNAIDGQSFIMTLIKPSSFSPFLAIAGVFMTMFCRSEKKKKAGSVMLGFSIMMIGMNMMSAAVSPLREIPTLQKTLISLSNPFLGFGFACLFAMLIQSSDAVIGIVQAFALSVTITYGTAIPLICGAQVGTCITAVISSLAASNNGKRTALLNLFYNLLKTIPFMVVFYVLNGIFKFPFMDSSVRGIGIPLVHTSLNILGSALWLPMSDVIVALTKRSIPLNEKEKQEQANKLTMLDEHLLVNPQFALEQADKAVLMLADTVESAFDLAIESIGTLEQAEAVTVLYERAQQYERQIDDYLMKCSKQDLIREDRGLLALLVAANSVFGDMSTLTKRILEMSEKLGTSSDVVERSNGAALRVLGESISEILQLTITGFMTRNTDISKTIRYYREEITDLGATVKKKYIRYTQEHGRDEVASYLCTGISYAQEQLIDYCDMIAEILIRYAASCEGDASRVTSKGEISREQIHELFRDKFEML